MKDAIDTLKGVSKNVWIMWGDVDSIWLKY